MFKIDGANVVASHIVQPAVLCAPIRADIVHSVHTSMAKNKRQAYAVSAGAGHQHSAHSWGTGRAVARIPRVSGGGTSRAGQAAFGNMCRAGRMFAPTKTWRKWHRKINVGQKRFAVASAIAASALPGLVMGRGHAINSVPEIPLVVDTAIESLKKTKEAVIALKAIGAYADVEKCAASKKVRAGKGKMRGRRHVMRRGPLIVYAADKGVVRAFRNLSGVEIAHVDSLNLLQLAPGGHLGRFVIWSQDAFVKLNAIWGSQTRVSTHKSGYTLPQPLMANSDLVRLINSDEIQSVVRPAIKTQRRKTLKKNPLTNLGAMIHLNPYALPMRRAALLQQERAAKAKKAAAEARAAGKPVVKTVHQIKRNKASKQHKAKVGKANYHRLLAIEAPKATAKRAPKEPVSPKKAQKA